MTLPPLSLYIHIPWCVRKCPYCDFNSHAQRDPLPELEYVAALADDLADELARLAQPRPLHSIFIGGGTPSLFSADAIAHLLEQVDAQMGIGTDTEITLEANPGTFEQARFHAYRKAGINRLSLGIQSFDNARLEALGRIHDGAEAIRAAHLARELFPRLNLDLMHGLPGQDTRQALKDIEQALALEPDHLSWYQLTLEPNTEFHARPPALPMDETLWQIQDAGQQRLLAAGFEPYEISAWARDGQASRHNLNYWEFGDYLGIGAGAHGKISHWQGEELFIERHSKARQPRAYLEGRPRTASRQPVEKEERLFEFMLNALRLQSGVDVALFSARTGLPLDTLRPLWQQACTQGLMEDDPQRLVPTQQGRLFLNDLLTLFL